jgi:hypothetical protein
MASHSLYVQRSDGPFWLRYFMSGDGLDQGFIKDQGKTERGSRIQAAISRANLQRMLWD